MARNRNGGAQFLGRAKKVFGNECFYCTPGVVLELVYRVGLNPTAARRVGSNPTNPTNGRPGREVKLSSTTRSSARADEWTSLEN